MKTATYLALSSAAGAMIFSVPASGDYTGLSVVRQSVIAGGELRNVYRVYADFSDPGDFLTVVYGSSTLGAMVIQSRNLDDTAPGSDFFNPIRSNLAPSALQVFGGTDSQTNPVPPIPDAAYETFCTIGIGNSGEAPSGYDGTFLAPNTPAWLPFISGNHLSTTNGGWVLPGQEQGRAGYTGDGDLPLRVLMMQLTVSSTSNVRGTVIIGGLNHSPMTGYSSFTSSGQTFNSIPGPSGIALICVAALGNARHRRRS